MNSAGLTQSIFRGRAAHLRIGKRGERAAVRLLRSKGFQILYRNWRSGSGELDIVARDGRILVFVEVKSLRYRAGVRPADNLRPGQIKRIRRGSRKYLHALMTSEPPPFRYDLIEVLLTTRSVKTIFHHQNCYTTR